MHNIVIVMAMNTTLSKVKIVSLCIISGLFLATLMLKLVAPAFIGLIIYLLTKHLGVFLNRRLSARKSRLMAGLMVLIGIVTIITLLTLFLSKTLGSQENLIGLTNKIVEILTDMREKLPPLLVSYIPESIIGFKESLTDFLREHSQELGKVGGESLHTLAHILIAIAIAVMVSIQRFLPKPQTRPLAFELRERLTLLGIAFENVVFAQAKISAINTTLTALFLFVILPLASVHLPYTKTLILMTFIVGLLPVVGNLISNTAITLVALGVSFHVALSALVFLILVHKLEYFINARIVGDRINAKAWEILLAMLLMESLFGVGGLLLAPIIYAYIKAELKLMLLI